MEAYAQSYNTALHSALAGMEASDYEGRRLEADEALERLCKLSRDCGHRNATQFFCGNGASAAFSSHMALDWAKNAAIKSVALNDGPFLTALANDIGSEALFSRALEVYAGSGDMLITVSSSGNSSNILHAIDAARANDMQVVTLSGLKEDNASRNAGDVNMYVPAKTYGITECAHQVILHMWFDRYLGVQEWARSDYQDMREESFRL